MKWLIMFKGGVETQEFFSVEMSRTFIAKGFHIYWYDLMLQQESAAALKRFYKQNKQSEIITFTFNFHGIAGETGLYDANCGWNFWDDSGIPVYNMVVDHPLYYQKYRDFVPNNYTQISIDRNHVKYLKRFWSDIHLFGEDGFLPLGGTELNADGNVMKGKKYLSVSERPIDVIFTGNYTPPSDFEKFLRHMDQDYIDFYHSLVEEICQNPELLIEDLAEYRLKEELGDLTDEQISQCMPNMMFVDLSVRFYYRAQVLKQLVDHGVRVDVYGAGWELLDCKHPENLILHGNVDSQKCLDMISQAKISINVMPWFKDGAHDRIFNSILNGALCISDESNYLREQFVEQQELIYYSLNKLEDVPKMVLQLLNEPEKIQQITDRAYEKCIGSHTWTQRANEIYERMGKCGDISCNK